MPPRRGPLGLARDERRRRQSNDGHIASDRRPVLQARCVRQSRNATRLRSKDSNRLTGGTILLGSRGAVCVTSESSRAVFGWPSTADRPAAAVGR